MTDNTESAMSEPRLRKVSGHRTTGQPIVLEYKRRKNKKDKKYRYSGSLKDAQVLERHLSRIALQQAKAITRGVETYTDVRDKSALGKRDGAVRDFIPNMGDAWAEGLDEASDIPREVAKMLNSKTSRRALRKQLRMMSNPVRTMRR
jgi:hypothetical protein